MSAQTVAVQIDDQTVLVRHGTPAGAVLSEHQPSPPQPPLAVLAYNRCVGLTFPLTADTKLVALDYRSRLGVLVYRRTTSLILLEAIRRIYGAVHVHIGQALGNGYAYDIDLPQPPGKQDVDDITAQMAQIIKEDVALAPRKVTLAEARRIFSERNDQSALKLLDTRWETHLPLISCGEHHSIHHFPVAPRTGLIDSFELTHTNGNLVLRFPPRGTAKPIAPFADSPKLRSAYRERGRWLKLLGLETAGDLNAITLSGDAGELIRVAEGLHEKKIARIADQIAGANDPVRVVLIAGPSSSGKTTFSKRLSLQLQVNGLRPIALSTDNFYVNREDTPLDADGKYDFEAIEAIDLALFNNILSGLLKGKEVDTPRFDFTTGQRRSKDKWRPMKLEAGQVLVIEGIHGLNPRLTEAVPKEQKFEIYINALSQLSVDSHHRIYTSDTRLLRRLVRDRKFRNYSAATTIEHWLSVRRGELKNIYPYQEEADAMFDSALPYEFGVIHLYAERFLLEVPKDHPSFPEAYRLLRFISNFVPIFEQTIPQISILKEFTGGSYFTY